MGDCIKSVKALEELKTIDLTTFHKVGRRVENARTHS